MSDARLFLRYAKGLRGHLRRTVTADEARRAVADQLARREETFLDIVARAIYGHPPSLYRKLLLNAGIEHGDVQGLVRGHGVEGALERLHDAGVHVTLDEFKGRRPIVRPGLELTVEPDAFANPLVRGTYVTSTGGSRGPRRRTLADFENLQQGALMHRLFLDTFELNDRPAAIWRAAPPGMAGLSAVTGLTKAGRVPERWWSHSRPGPRRGALKEPLFAAYTVLAGRVYGVKLPFPSYTPAGEAGRVARWLAEQTAAGHPALLATTASSGVRACLAAEQLGLDVSGTFFRLSGEPFTPGKAAVIERAGARAVANYSMTEAGRVGIACATPEVLDDMHLVSHRLAVIQRDRVAAGVLVMTSVHAHAPRILLNVESDDYATLEERECGCLLGSLGLTRHLHGVRSHEKLTSEGMTFLGSDLIDLLDEILPARFGGSPTDYQLVEDEVGGLPRVTVVVSPSVGPVDEAALIEAVIGGLSEGPGYKAMMANAWRDGDTLRVARREPYATGAGKILSLHVESS